MLGDSPAGRLPLNSCQMTHRSTRPMLLRQLCCRTHCGARQSRPPGRHLISKSAGCTDKPRHSHHLVCRNPETGPSTMPPKVRKLGIVDGLIENLCGQVRSTRSWDLRTTLAMQITSFRITRRTMVQYSSVSTFSELVERTETIYELRVNPAWGGREIHGGWSHRHR
jgi:hypothetical protein